MDVITAKIIKLYYSKIILSNVFLRGQFSLLFTSRLVMRRSLLWV